MSNRSEAELVQFRKAADTLARGRKERVNTVHLLAVLCGEPGAASDLIATRRLEQPTLLKAARAFDEELPDAIADALAAARDLARRAAVPSACCVRSSRQGTRSTAAAEPGGMHLLVALLSNRRFAAARALGQLGIDVGRLRMAALQMAFGVVPPLRTRAGGSTRSERAAPAHTDLSARTTPSARTGGEARSLSPRSPASSGATEPTRSSGPRSSTARSASPRSTASRSASAPRSARASRAVQVSLFPPIDAAREKPSTVARPAAPIASRSRSEAAARPAGRRACSKAPTTDPIEVLALDPVQFPALTSLGRNLSLAASHGELEPVVGREAEIEQVLDVLAKRHANCALLVGPPGVGKTSVARGIAHRFAAAAACGSGCILVELSLTELLAGTASRGTLAERAAALRAEVRRAAGRVVLFIDEIQDLVGTPAADELVNEMKVALERGELPLVGACTSAALRRTIEGDAVLARRFTLVEVEEPDEPEAMVLLRAVADGLARHHHVRYGDDAIVATLGWTSRYLQGRALPDKAVAVLDLAGARVHRRGQPMCDERALVDPEAVAQVVSEQAGVPVERLLQSDRERMLQLESFLGDRVVGHAHALTKIASALRRNAAGLRSRRPIGSFLLLGPTGVGKTETAKAVAEALFDSPDAMARIDLSEYAEAHAVARLIGSPPGYVGHEAGGELTEAVRRRPYQVVLLDEIEKAHRDVLQAFLQVLDEGRLTDGRGRCTDFTNTVIVLTSNLGSAELHALGTERRVGFGSTGRRATGGARAEEVAIGAAKKALPPELYNRLDEVIVYGSLGEQDVREIAERQLQTLAATLLDRDVDLLLDRAAIDALMAAGGYQPEYGARPMRRAIARLVEGPLAELLLGGELPPGSAVEVGVDGAGQLRIRPRIARRGSSASVALGC